MRAGLSVEGMMDVINDINVETVVVGPNETNCYLVFDPESLAGSVVDPGEEPDVILDLIHKLGLRIVNLIFTHGHYDHIGALEQLARATRAPVLIHALDADLLRNPIANGSLFFGQNINTPKADQLLNDGDIISVGDFSLKVIHTPGHTRGGICLAGPGFVFSGDTLFRNSVGRTDLPGSEPDKLIPSIRGGLLSLPDDTRVFPGHGNATTIGHERKRNPHLAGTLADI